MFHFNFSTKNSSISHTPRHHFLLPVPDTDHVSLVLSYHNTVPALSLSAENFPQWRPNADKFCPVGGGAHIFRTLCHFKDSSDMSTRNYPKSKIKR